MSFRSFRVALMPALVMAALGAQEPAVAQTLPELTASPDSAAVLFIRSIRSLRWSAAAQFVDEETLGLFRDVVTMITEVEQSGELLGYLTDTDTASFRALDASEVFARALTRLTSDMPGLANSLADRDDEILGHVAERSDTAHVVYRTQMRLSGSVPEVNVMQMRRGPEGWRVLWSDELDVLETALRGAVRLRRSPTPPPPPRPPHGSFPPPAAGNPPGC
jgi:hypothetical protein